MTVLDCHSVGTLPKKEMNDSAIFKLRLHPQTSKAWPHWFIWSIATAFSIQHAYTTATEVMDRGWRDENCESSPCHRVLQCQRPYVTWQSVQRVYLHFQLLRGEISIWFSARTINIIISSLLLHSVLFLFSTGSTGIALPVTAATCVCRVMSL